MACPSSQTIQLATVALYSRGELSKGNSRRIFHFEAYHWGLLITPKEGQGGRRSHAFEATDASEMDKVTFRLNNPTMDWWYKYRLNVNSEDSKKFLGQVVVGEIPEEVSGEELTAFFRQVPMPVKGTDPQQSCVTWTVSAIQAMQERGWAQDFDIEAFKEAALAYADDRIKEDSVEPVIKYYEPQPQSEDA